MFSQLYDRTSATLFSLCLSVLHDQEQAEDCLQDAYLKIWKHADMYQPSGLSPMTWLVTITRNTAIDLWRENKRSNSATTPETVNTLEYQGRGPEKEASDLSERAAIERCLDELDTVQAAVIRNAYLHGTTYAQLADSNNMPINTVRSWLRRGLQKLRECLTDD